jgi:hypothetical protein
MLRLALDEWPQFRTQRLVRHEVDRAAEQIPQVELHAEIALRRGRTVEHDEDVDVGVRPSLPPGGRAEQGDIQHAEATLQLRLVFAQQGQGPFAIH